MTEQRMLDFVRALVDADADFVPPSVAPVKMQVRTGASVPPKPDMLARGYVVLVWSYTVSDLARFKEFISTWEEGMAHFFDPDVVDGKPVLAYHGTFPVRSAGGAPTKRFKTMWGGERERIHFIEKCRIARRDKLTGRERELATNLHQMFSLVVGDVEVEFLDPGVDLNN
jgi:hypothetical protein